MGYDPTLGRFAQADSIIPPGPHPHKTGTGGLDRYAYVNNNPLRYTDPSGHSVDPPCWFCNTTWLNYSSTNGILNKAIDSITKVGCFFAGCHVDSDTDIITGPTREEAMNATVLSMVSPMSMPASRAVSSISNVSDDVIYSGVRKASQFLQDIGVPREYRKQILESFVIPSITMRTAGPAEYGMRYFDNINAFGRGRTLFSTLPASRENLALLPEWNAMTNIKQWQIRPGATIIEGIIAPQGRYGGGFKQMFTNFLTDLLEVR